MTSKSFSRMIRIGCLWFLLLFVVIPFADTTACTIQQHWETPTNSAGKRFRTTNSISTSHWGTSNSKSLPSGHFLFLIIAPQGTEARQCILFPLHSQHVKNILRFTWRQLGYLKPLKSTCPTDYSITLPPLWNPRVPIFTYINVCVCVYTSYGCKTWHQMTPNIS